MSIWKNRKQYDDFYAVNGKRKNGVVQEILYADLDDDYDDEEVLELFNDDYDKSSAEPLIKENNDDVQTFKKAIDKIFG